MNNPPNISPPMPLDLSNISQPPNRKPKKLAIQSSSNALPDTRLAHPRRTDETYDFPMYAPAQFTHG